MGSKNQKRKRNLEKKRLKLLKLNDAAASKDPTPPKVPKIEPNKTKCILTDFLNESDPGQIKNRLEPFTAAESSSDSSDVSQPFAFTKSSSNFTLSESLDITNNSSSSSTSKPPATINKSFNSIAFPEPLTDIENISSSSKISQPLAPLKNDSNLTTLSESLAPLKKSSSLSTVSNPLTTVKNNSDLATVTDTLDASEPVENKADSTNFAEKSLILSKVSTDISSSPSAPENKNILQTLSDSSLCLPIESPKDCHSIPLQEELARLRSENSQLKKEIQALKASASKLKSGLYCTICLNYYHVPHSIDCGHVFCFSCLRSWLKSLVEKNCKLECPLCRHNITKVPNLVLTLHQHLLELLQEDSSQHTLVLQSIQEHFVCFQGENNKWGTIFPKCGVRASIYDAEDDVARCTTCNWEVVGKFCANCNAAYSGTSEEEHSDSSTSVSDDNSDGSLNESLSNLIPESEYGLPVGSKNSDSDSADSFVCKDGEVDFESDHEIEADSTSDSDVSVIRKPNSKKNHVSEEKDPTETQSEASVGLENSPIVSKTRIKKSKRLVVSDSD